MRQYLVTACEMKRYDGNTTEKYQIPSLVLMERAALVTTEELQRARGTAPCRVLVVAGGGNNGGDGLAVGRLLMLQGYDVTFVLLAHESRCSAQTVKQTGILREYQARIFSTIQDGEYDIVIDAIFGIGLSRPAEGIYAEAVAWINRSGAYVCSVDIPSGIRADTGEIMGCAVRADLTVTYGFLKIGQILYPVRNVPADWSADRWESMRTVSWMRNRTGILIRDDIQECCPQDRLTGTRVRSVKHW